MDDQQVRYVKIRDTAELDLEGQQPVKLREYVFMIGPHGPFTERVRAENADSEIANRVAALRASLASLPR